MEKYILLFGDKKPEDNICLTNMFSNSQKINLGWTDIDYNNNMKIIENKITNGTNQIIFSGLEIGWGKMIKDIKNKHSQVKIKVICTTSDSLLYYEYERNNFFELLELSKENIVYDIAFLRKGQYETYKNLGYKCSFLRENYTMLEEHKKDNEQNNEEINLGIYPLNYTWDKNIFNQLCIPKFLENCNLNYYNLDPRMEEFLTTMEIKNTPEKVQKIDAENIIKSVLKNDVIVSTSFTEYMHPVFLISMELGIPCLVGNNSDLFEQNEELSNYVVTLAEDNAIINSEKVNKMLKNKEKIISLYKEWKEKYNKIAKESIKEFLEK